MISVIRLLGLVAQGLNREEETVRQPLIAYDEDGNEFHISRVWQSGDTYALGLQKIGTKFGLCDLEGNPKKL